MKKVLTLTVLGVLCGVLLASAILLVLGFLWGAAIGSVKRFFYKKWLPQSQYALKTPSTSIIPKKASASIRQSI